MGGFERAEASALVNQPRGPDGRWRPYYFRFGSLFAVGAVSVGAAIGFGGVGTGAGSAGSGAAAGADTPTISVQARTARGQQRSGRIQRALVGRGLRATLRAQDDSGSCAGNARGQVREFLATHQCESVYRGLVEVRRGDVAVLAAIAWIDMTEEADATALKALVDRPGTGNVNQLAPPRGQRAVSVVEPAYASQQRDRLVVTVEAEPVAVTRQQRVVEEIAEQVAQDANESR